MHYNKLHTTNNNSHFLMKDRWQKWKNSGRWKKRVIKREMCAAMCVCVSWMDWLCLFRISHHFRSAGTHKHIMRSSIIRHFSNLDNSNEITLEQSSSYGRTTRLTIHILYNIFFSCEFQKSVNIFIYLLCVCSGFFFGQMLVSLFSRMHSVFLIPKNKQSRIHILMVVFFLSLVKMCVKHRPYAYYMHFFLFIYKWKKMKCSLFCDTFSSVLCVWLFCK